LSLAGGIRGYVYCMRLLFSERYLLSFKALEEAGLTVTRMDMRLVDDLRYLMIGVVQSYEGWYCGSSDVMSYGFTPRGQSTIDNQIAWSCVISVLV